MLMKRKAQIYLRKYKGEDLETINNKDPKYINYLLDKSKEEEILNACKELIRKGV